MVYNLNMMNQNKKSKQIREKIKEFYNTVAEPFSRTRNQWWNDLRFISQYLKRDHKVLDFGCGNGRLLQFLQTSNENYWGIDISEKLIGIARNKYPENHFKVIEKETEIPFSDNYFDNIFSIAVFHHFNPEMMEKTLQEFNRILKKDGVLILTVWHLWNKKQLKFLLKRWFSGHFELSANLPFQDRQQTHWRLCYWWRKSKLETVLRKNQFEIIKSGVTYNKKGGKRNIFVVAKNLA